MSNNDLWCNKCNSQHHPAECPLNDERKRAEDVAREIVKPIKKQLQLYVDRDSKYVGSEYSAVNAFVKEIRVAIADSLLQFSKEERACSGCGRRKGDKIKPPALACCPDANFVTASEMWDKKFHDSKDYIKHRVEQEREACAEVVETWAEDNKTVQPSFAGIVKAIRERGKE